MCGCIQLAVDIAIIAQIALYSKPEYSSVNNDI